MLASEFPPAQQRHLHEKNFEVSASACHTRNFPHEMEDLKRIVFFGSDAIAIPILETIESEPLSKIAKLEAIFSQPDRPQGRGQKIHPNAVAKWAREHGVKLFQPEKLGEESVQILKNLKCDIGLVMAYGHILRPALIAAPTIGIYNYHASLLPRYRGPAPVEAAIANNDGGAGVTLQKIAPALDEGDVVGSAVIPLDCHATRASLRDKISEACIFITQDTLPRIINGTAEEIPQSEKRVSYTRKISRADAGIDFSFPAKKIAARIRALCGWPGCTISFDNLELKIGDAIALANDAFPRDGIAPGTVVASGKSELVIATGDGFLQVCALQRPGGKMLATKDFLAGMKIPAGTFFESREMRPLFRSTPWLRKK
ncbi:MAG: methionyl-tRNA formyltransferase [Opitutae bacterium]|nr:methionyl-tRNA formyltransferase [Opitutae bacterium]